MRRPPSLLRLRRAVAPLIAIAASLALHAPALVAQPTPRPNVVLVLTDDLDLLLGTLDHLPNIRRLLSDAGTTLTGATVTNSLCCPSRSTLLRGQYTHSHRVYTNVAPTGGHAKFRALGRDSSTLATWLHDAGYATALLGKYLNGYPGRDRDYVPPGWTRWSSPVAGGYGMYDYALNEDGAIRRYGHAASDYITDVLARQAREFVRASAAAGTPFYLEVATYAPHQPATVAPRHRALLPDLRAPRTPSFDAAGAGDGPARLRRRPLDPAEMSRLDSLYRRRVLSMLAVDELVASLVATLDSTGQLGRTYVVFTSDNGFHLGQHRLLAGKATAYEEDVRVPFIVRGPGVAAGHRVDALVENVDVAPTFAALAGAPVPAFVDGRSILPLLRGETPRDWRRVALVEAYAGAVPDARAMRLGIRPRRAAGRARDVERTPRYVALRGARFTYVRHASGERELYDLARDPHQLENRAAATPPDVLAALDEWARALARCSGAECRTLEGRVPAPLRALVGEER
jgi:arylsulfatase A-like enzyme